LAKNRKLTYLFPQRLKIAKSRAAASSSAARPLPVLLLITPGDWTAPTAAHCSIVDLDGSSRS